MNFSIFHSILVWLLIRAILYLFICLRYNKYTKIIQISNVMNKNLPQNYIKIHVTIISLVDSD